MCAEWMNSIIHKNVKGTKDWENATYKPNEEENEL